jgi:hypothetical protein
LYNLITDSEEWVYNVSSLWDDPGFSLTPSGTGILYTVYQSSQPLEMWILDLEDESTSFVREGFGGAISPDGQWIAFTTNDDQLAIAPMSGGPPALFDLGGMPKWTPDSEHIVYTGIADEDHLDLFVMHRDGSFNQQLTDDLELDMFPVVSPDGREVAYQKCIGEFDGCSIWVLDLSTVIPVGRQSAKNPDVFSVPDNGQPDKNLEITTTCRLSGPNPTNPSSAFEFTLKESGNVRLEIYDVRGRLIRRVVSEKKPAGDHIVTWNGNDANGQHVSSGVYFYMFETGSYRTTGKIAVVR